MKTLLAALLFASLGYALPAQVIIIRHGEKGEDSQLTQKGFERAGALTHYFTQTAELLNFGLPRAIFAARPVHVSDDDIPRCIQTMTPTANALSLPVHSPFGTNEEGALAQLILSDRRYNGKNVVICWHHSRILELIQSFGYVPPISHIPNNRFDLTFVMTFPLPSPSPTATLLLQELMFGDPTTPPT